MAKDVIDDSLWIECPNHYGQMSEVSNDDVFDESEYQRLIDPHGLESGDSSPEDVDGAVRPLAPEAGS